MKILSFFFLMFVFPLSGYAQTKFRTATFAGGCFWCMQPPFENVKGVEKVVSGYAGGKGDSPTYENYAQKGYIEAVQVTYDPALITYSRLLEIFWRQIDPTDPDGQFCDRGKQYRAAILFDTPQQKNEAQDSKARLDESGRFDKPVVTEIIAYTNFYPAEDYHQDYHTKNPIRYKFYRFTCGRDQLLNKYWSKTSSNEIEPAVAAKDPSANLAQWKKPGAEVLKTRLTPMQYKVTQENGTEPAYRNAYWDNHKEGIYVDIVSGEPVFSSIDKYDSKTGWPSFTRPLEPENIVEKEDRGWFMSRTEVRSKYADSHLGHVFNDGPQPTGLRYCMNSAALRFVPKEDLEKEGYGRYIKLFEAVFHGE